MAENESKSERQFAVHRIYAKDLSFESPNTPDIFRENGQPKHELNINTKVNKKTDDTFEVVLSVTVNTTWEEKTLYIVEVHMAGLFAVKGFPEQELAHLFGAYCPNLLFPYAREVITDLVTKGSFPQLVLQPVNFDAILARQQEQAASQARADSGQATH